MQNLSRRNFLKSMIALGTTLSLFKLLDNDFYYNKDICLSKKIYAMGTSGNITIYCKDEKYGNLLLNEAAKNLNRLEFLLTKFSTNSDISRINLNPNFYNYVSRDVLNLLKLGSYITDNTFGYFDMGMGNLLSYYRIDSNVPILGNVTQICDMKFSLLDISGNKVKLNRPNSMLDLGGIGKGYAIDYIVDFLRENGIKHIAFEFGGDIKVFGGLPDGKPWKLFLDPKFSYLFNKKNRIFFIKNGSIAVSGSYIKKSPFKNKFVNHHIIDPNMLISKDYYYMTIVIGKSAAICDALSTAFYNVDSLCYNMIKNNFNDYDVILHK